jgi:hypothetical protein
VVRLRILFLTSTVASLCGACWAAGVPPGAAANLKPRIFVLTDIGNEPDDQMSLVRLLVYSNSVDIEGLVATTSTWKRNVVSPETIRSVIDAYSRVRNNLLQHEGGWPTADSLLKVVTAGRPGYGMDSIAQGPPSDGARLLLTAAQRQDARPLWITDWGGASTLAEALRFAQSTLPSDRVEKLIAKLRVYSISDQDDAGPWIRRNFPNLFYIVKPSPPDGAEYASATWTGISGDEYYRNGEGADGSLVSQEWLQTHIRSKGPLGAHYPKHLFIMEGDTPSYLGLIPNGLNSEENPSWGGWGGRYFLRQPYGETHPIWTQGGDLFTRTTSADTVIGIDGRSHTSDQATIWRWRRAYQNDFAARMDWTIRDVARANHPPRVIVNKDATGSPIEIDINVGEAVQLDASGTTDPDHDALDFEWFQYQEAGASLPQPSGTVTLEQTQGEKITIRADAACRSGWLPAAKCGPSGVAHVILAVTDHGSPALTRYRRIILRIHAKE